MISQDIGRVGSIRMLAGNHIPRAEFRTAHGVCEQMLQLAEQSQDPLLLVMASQCRAKVHYYEGDLVSAHQHGERALALDRREYHEAYLSLYNEDGETSARREHRCDSAEPVADRLATAAPGLV
jgi:hypothetical protein